jgi:hypothetical protein
MHNSPGAARTASLRVAEEMAYQKIAEAAEKFVISRL